MNGRLSRRWWREEEAEKNGRYFLNTRKCGFNEADCSPPLKRSSWFPMIGRDSWVNIVICVISAPYLPKGGCFVRLLEEMTNSLGFTLFTQYFLMTSLFCATGLILWCKCTARDAVDSPMKLSWTWSLVSSNVVQRNRTEEHDVFSDIL